MKSKITSLSAQVRDANRVNVSVDGKYRFSLDIYQVTELGIKVGNEYSESELQELEEESVFGKTYTRTLEYTLVRPRSAKEVRDYLWRKTIDKKVRNRKTGEIFDKKGVSKEVAARVQRRLTEKGYVDDEKFALWWVENRNLRKGISVRKLENELRAKGVESSIIASTIQNSPRGEKSELEKVIAKKSKKYADERKLVAYLLQQGFRYDDIRDALDADHIEFED